MSCDKLLLPYFLSLIHHSAVTFFLSNNISFLLFCFFFEITYSSIYSFPFAFTHPSFSLNFIFIYNLSFSLDVLHFMFLKIFYLPSILISFSLYCLFPSSLYILFLTAGYPVLIIYIIHNISFWRSHISYIDFFPSLLISSLYSELMIYQLQTLTLTIPFLCILYHIKFLGEKFIYQFWNLYVLTFYYPSIFSKMFN